jgi:hypothetical protein
LKFEFWFEQMGFGPLGPTSPPGSVEPDQLGSGSVNRSSPAPSLSLSLPRELWQTLNHLRRRPTNPANSGGLRRRCLGQNRRPNSLYHLFQLESTGASSPRRSVGGFPLVFAVAGHLRLDASPSPLLCLLCNPWWLWSVCVVAVLRRSWCAVVKTTLWSLWPAAQALPCHAVQTSTQAMVSMTSPPLYSSASSLATVSGHLVKDSEPSSQTLFCDAVSCC